jgi:UDPglucose 6-dehydrogenase
MKKVKATRISIIGSGVVGEATGRVFHMQGHDVLFHDINQGKLDALANDGCAVTASVAEAVHHADVVFICVPTPTVNQTFDCSFVETAATDIGRALADAEDYKIVVVRSTVLPSTTRGKVLPLLEKYSRRQAGRDFGVCMNPEFLREKTALQDSLHPSRIVIGELDRRSGDAVAQLYASFEVPLIRADLETAELVKYAANLFLATKISFFNEIYMIGEQLGVDAATVSKAASLDPRIGEYGVYGGKPFDGKCFPKDYQAFNTFARGLRINPKLLEAALDVNAEISAYISGRSKTEDK